MSGNMLSEKTQHELAYSCYNNRQYAKAADLFRFLAMHNAVSFDYWFGLGSALLMQQKKEGLGLQAKRIQSLQDVLKGMPKN